MEETLIQFETGQLAKDKGFNIPCDARWWTECCAKWMESKQGAVKCNNSSEDSIARPTQSLLQKSKQLLKLESNCCYLLLQLFFLFHPFPLTMCYGERYTYCKYC